MPYCERCDYFFSSDYALYQHFESSDYHHECITHGEDFTTRQGLIEHWKQSPYHFYCGQCDEHFVNARGLANHNEYEHFPCPSCNKIFYSTVGLEQHQRQAHVPKYYCDDCQRGFASIANYNAHRMSTSHVPKSIKCPGLNCNKLFHNMASLFAHFETGTCPSGATREMLNRRVVQMDRGNMITNPQRLIQGPGGTYDAPAVTQTWATELSWNGRMYECFLCHREFRALHSLNAHLQSPTHQDRIYRCPGCRYEFVSLSGLTQHVESDKCGVKRFKQVQDLMDGLTSRMRTIAL
ncbi:hypothetical protein B0H10DRAFT_2161234 [Mycena sp. CBHHK59/15]|nr:hypothetical protein B0H10DRAFT_2161234 [Mycena sp. CBHHK59/15]